jgi:transcription-repair coupling factor (superfamily II helicase)
MSVLNNTEALVFETIKNVLSSNNEMNIIIFSDEASLLEAYRVFKNIAPESLPLDEIKYLSQILLAGPYRYESPKLAIANHIELLSKFFVKTPRICLVTLSSLFRNIPSHDWIEKSKLSLSKNSHMNIDFFLSYLERSLYSKMSLVESIGEYSIRGCILDLWSPNYEHPIRIEFDDDKIIGLRAFRVYDQVSFGELDTATFYPAREFQWPEGAKLEELIESFDKVILRQKISGTQRVNVVESLRSSFHFPGLDDLSYLFHNENRSFFEELTLFVKKKGLRVKFSAFSKMELIEDTFTKIISQYSQDKNKNFLTPVFDKLYPAHENNLLELRNSINFLSFKYSAKELFSQEGLIYKLKRFSQRVFAIERLFQLKRIEHCYLISSNDETLCETLSFLEKVETQIFKKENESPRTLSSISILYSNKLAHAKQSLNNNVSLIQSDFSGVLHLKENAQLVVSDKWLKGNAKSENLFSYDDLNDEEPQAKAIRRKLLSMQISEFSEGDLVVHVQYGVGRYLGLITLKTGDFEEDFLSIEYKNKDKIYVPVHKLNQVQRYIGNLENLENNLDNMRSKTWKKKRQKAREDAQKTAEELMHHQAKRALTKGFAFSSIGEEYLFFEEEFPFDETPDQIQAIKDIMKDMGAPKAMDRLLCGDVGFGKTEVAMRAAYRSVLDSKQVAWLVPTTVLAHQHFRTLKERFQKFPIKIEVLDRSLSSRKAEDVFERVQSADIDIIVGTHRIFSKSLKFKALGLLIVDEEQRFGVIQKEKIKRLSYGIDNLTMTATPIPRTLQLAMVGLKDLSLLTTAPKSRLAVKTFVCPFDEELIKDAILREVSRGGQIIYVHNRVSELKSVYSFLLSLSPQISCRMAHGQMLQKDLESCILDYLDNEFNVLLCTTIIESGMDMPNVNTIIVQNADHFGLSQLYQLRGRVGRRSTQGFAYFLKSHSSHEKDDGVKRLKILHEHQALGSGFVVASQDLEMRGAGNIAGGEQSGRMHEVGFDTYNQLLEEAISELKGQEQLQLQSEIDIQLPVEAHIPKSFIGSSKERINVYRRLFEAKSEEERACLLKECEDRYGKIPEQIMSLAEISRLRYALQQVYAKGLYVSARNTELRFDIRFLQSQRGEIHRSKIHNNIFKSLENEKGLHLLPDGTLVIPVTSGDFRKNKIETFRRVKRLLTLLSD